MTTPTKTKRIVNRLTMYQRPMLEHWLMEHGLRDRGDGRKQYNGRRGELATKATEALGFTVTEFNLAIAAKYLSNVHNFKLIWSAHNPRKKKAKAKVAKVTKTEPDHTRRLFPWTRATIAELEERIGLLEVMVEKHAAILDALAPVLRLAERNGR